MKSKTTEVPPISVSDVRSAASRIQADIVRTPLVFSPAASLKAGMPVYLKLENLQRTGAFKVRGALNKIKSLTDEERKRGVICASTGNHGLGVAYACKSLNTRCIVVLPENPNPFKVALLKDLQAEIITHGINSDERQIKMEELSARHGYSMVHPFGDPLLIAGQGTIGLEILQDLPEVEEIYIPIGGGGLISGISVAVKEQRPATRIYGVEPENSNAMAEALRHGGPIALQKVETIADGLAAKITEPINFSTVKRFVDEILIVSERQIIDATLFLLEYANVLVEPSSAASFAGLLSNPRKSGKAAVVISGGNVSLQQIDHIRSLQRE